MVWINKNREYNENRYFSKWLRNLKGTKVIYIQVGKKKWRLFMIVDPELNVVQHICSLMQISLDELCDPLEFIERVHWSHDLKFADYEMEIEPYYDI